MLTVDTSTFATRSWWLIRAIACLGLITACGGDAHQTVDTQAMSELDEIGVSGLAAVEAGAERAMVLGSRAENVLTRDCMEAKGFQYSAQTGPDVEAEKASSLGWARLSVQDASREGYTQYLQLPTPEGSAEADDQRRYVDGLSEQARTDYYLALGGQEGDPDARTFTTSTGFGVTLSGCSGDAAEDLYGERLVEVYDLFYAVQTLDFQLDIEGTSIVSRALEQWSACMASSGHDFASPDDAIAAGLHLRGSASQPVAGEVDIAVADATCRQESGLIGAVEQAFRERNAELLADNLDLVLSWRDVEGFILDRAGEVLDVELG